MLEQLILNNFESGYEPTLAPRDKAFVMSTCQRTIVLNFGHNPFEQIENSNKTHLVGNEAYSFLLEIICGLKSKLVGENEIVNQFKAAYQEYVTANDKCSNLLSIIEKLFKDAKEIRSSYLIGLSQKTYSSIARKHIVNKYNADSVLIIGSGQLAEDLINQFKKKITVYLSARNTDKVLELAQKHNVEIISWGYHENLLKFPFIANSIGFKGVLFNQDFFQDWSHRHDKKLFVDLGSPSAVDTDFNYDQGVMKLTDVFEEGAIHETQKLNQIDQARKAMEGIVEKRHKVFQKKKLKIQSYNSQKNNTASYV
jgi:glutamyl-tRNA reductase